MTQALESYPNVEITFAPARTLEVFSSAECDAWLVEGPITFDQFIALYDAKSASHGPHHIFSSFDDYDQASYTSGHAMGKYGLDPSEDLVEGSLRFGDTLKKFLSQIAPSDTSDLKGRLSWGGEDDIASFVSINSDLDQCLDAYLVMQIVPVTMPEDALAAFPNGYFTDDMTPFENYHLARHMRIEHGLKLIAVGACYLCFLRDEPLDAAQAQALTQELLRLHEASDLAPAADAVEALLTGKRHLILNYNGG